LFLEVKNASVDCLNRRESEYHECEKPEDFSCIVESPFNKSFEDQLSIKVNASNDFGSDSIERNITLHHIGLSSNCLYNVYLMYSLQL